MNILLTYLFCILITLGSYGICTVFYRKYKKSWLNPLFSSSFLLVLLLLLFHIPEETYSQASSLFQFLLQLVVVSLAVPLYKQWTFIKKNYKKIFIGVMAGTAMGLLTVVLLAHFFHLKEQLLASLIPKSITLPIALTISSNLGGLYSTTIIFVIISALISVLIGPKLMQQLGIKSKAAKGLAMGTTAQMIGANTSSIWGEEGRTMGNVAMTTSALLLTLAVPIIRFIF
ncbi:LrgB family protein [Niallia endozanthoxylica]|uniref:LrgB family protein n=1 Tax=Niallia endozanthoxylica TaxID=2036016 RepID=A0A5J5HZQ5_9BACI|nr:LrgB family protein [Niallia endozanthoxylica]KAA9028581.1 LrgB family protein [Niallia endozanthoxylica]